MQIYAKIIGIVKYLGNFFRVIKQIFIPTMYLSNNIKYLRNVNNFTQEELANRVGIKRTNISNYEKEISFPDLNLLVKISNIFGVSIDELLKVDLSQGSNLPIILEKDLVPQNNSMIKWQPLQVEHNVMVVDNIAEAGSVSVGGDGVREGIPTYLPKLIPRKEPYIMVAVSGKSMEPDFYDGDYVVCYELTDRREMLADAVHVVTSSDGIFLKEVRYINDKSDDSNVGFLRLSSRNQRYQPIYLHPSQDQVKLYRVVSVLRSV